MGKKILYITPALSSFVVKDIELLNHQFSVTASVFSPSNKIFLPLLLVKQFFSLLFTSTDAYICMFAGYHSFLPIIIGKLLNRPVIIIAGGTDCVSFPSIQYGHFNNKILNHFCAFSFKHCNLICPVHEALIEQDYTYANETYSKQGIKAFIPEIRTPFLTIHNGYDANQFQPLGNRKAKTFVTIGANLGLRFSKKLKGIDLFIKAAEQFSEGEFTIIGGENHFTNAEIPKNVKLLGFIKNNKLPELLSKHEYYVQLSMSEGFPNALCEAMLCGCVPIVSKVGGMPFIVQDLGHVLQKKEDSLLFEIISKCKTEDTQLKSEKVRNRIANNFTLANRKKGLEEAVQMVFEK